MNIFFLSTNGLDALPRDTSVFLFSKSKLALNATRSSNEHSKNYDSVNKYHSRIKCLQPL